MNYINISYKINFVLIYLVLFSQALFTAQSNNTVSIHVVQDADGSFSFSQLDTVSKTWSLRLRSFDGEIDTSVSHQSTLTHSHLPDGFYILTQGDSTDWIHLGIIHDGVRARKIGITTDTITVIGGIAKQIIFVNSFDTHSYDSDYYRTFLPLEIATAPVKLVCRRTIPKPTVGNIVQKAYDEMYPPKFSKLTIGRVRKDSAKKYLWIEISTPKTFSKLLNVIHTGNPSPLIIPTNGKKGPIKNPKYNAEKMNNKLIAELIALKMNIAISDADILYPYPNEIFYKLSDLNYVGPETLYQRKFMREIALLADTMLTQRNDYASNLYVSIFNVIASANRAFHDTISPIANLVDTTRCTFLYPATMRIIDTNPRYWEAGMLPKKYFSYPQTDITLSKYSLLENYPNPFNPTTIITFYLEQAAHVSLHVYDVLGREITTLVSNQLFEEGEYDFSFDGSTLTSGIYFCRININNGEYVSTKKLLLMK